MLAPYYKYLGSPAFRRKLVQISPLKDLRDFADLIDVIHRQSKQILSIKREALEAGDAVLMEQVGAGKDIMSVLRTHTSYNHQIYRDLSSYSES